MDATDDEEIVIHELNGRKEDSVIRITGLLNQKFTFFTTHFDEKYHDTIAEYKRIIEAYQFPTIQIPDAPIDVATEIFTRINIGGKPLSLFEIMVAKTFDIDSGFDLTEKYDELISTFATVDYETISDATVLQVVSIFLEKECKRKTILKLDKQDFINIWPDAVDAIEAAVEFFRLSNRIPVSHLLPYNALIVPFSYFFYRHPQKPSGDMKRYLEDYFWRACLSERFSSGVETKLHQDILRIDEILDGSYPTYDWAIDIEPISIKNNGWFSAGRSYIKAILCLYAYQEPKSFEDNSQVNIQTNWLKKANSKNYHHFFPKSYMQKKGGFLDWEVNNILNITIVDDYLNKRVIGAQPPSKYMGNFSTKNPDIDTTMKSHLITDLSQFGIWTDDYQAFLNKRAEEVSNQLKSRVLHNGGMPPRPSH